jgi:hypothetical protein
VENTTTMGCNARKTNKTNNIQIARSYQILDELIDYIAKLEVLTAVL